MNKPKIADNIQWRKDGEDNQIILVSNDELPLPLMLNPTAARIFLLCDGNNSADTIAKTLCEEFDVKDFDAVLKDVQSSIAHFLEKGIVK